MRRPLSHVPRNYKGQSVKHGGYKMLFVIFFICVLSSTSTSQPINPADYQDIIRQGFSTNWFKTEKPLSAYNDSNIQDVYDKGFRNLRLRCRADLYPYPFDTSNFTSFLADLETVVDKCLEVGVAPIISWIHHHAEAYASEEDRQNYVTWWTKVANKLQHKDYRLSFNLFTELGIDECGSKETCGESLRMRPDKYNQWTADVVDAIRSTGGNNKKRILILGSPGKTAKDLDKINQTIYKNDKFIMAEWHLYASGPNKRVNSAKYWSGDGEPDGKANVAKAIKPATDFTADTGILTYLGAWMPQDNKDGSLNEDEVINFGRYFASELKKVNIPWSLNVLDRYYDTKNSQWLTGKQDIKGRPLNMSKVLENIWSAVNTNDSSRLSLHFPLILSLILVFHHLLQN